MVYGNKNYTGFPFSKYQAKGITCFYLLTTEAIFNHVKVA